MYMSLRSTERMYNAMKRRLKESVSDARQELRIVKVHGGVSGLLAKCEGRRQEVNRGIT
jgi:hypothetical protein